MVQPVKKTAYLNGRNRYHAKVGVTFVSYLGSCRFIPKLELQTVFCGFSESLQCDARVVPQIRPWSLPSTFCLVH